MRCPFLREAQVKFCRASAYSKMIVRLPEQPEHERCSTSGYVNCSVAKKHLEERPSIDHCPFLNESLVQYCTAAAITKYIPYTESILSKCGTNSHTYCELFLGLSQPNEAVSETDVLNIGVNGGLPIVDEIKIPRNLFYSPNHMWLDIGNDDVYHIGIDAFLSKVIGSCDHITFLTTGGFHRPTVSFSVRGVELQCTFPMQLNIVRANTYLRSNPEKVFADPYTIGWLFEVKGEKPHRRGEHFNGLISGSDAAVWMKKEIERMTSLAHTMSALPDMHEAQLMADGGSFGPGFAHHLTREDLLKLFNDYFSPLTRWDIQQ